MKVRIFSAPGVDREVALTRVPCIGECIYLRDFDKPPCGLVRVVDVIHLPNPSIGIAATVMVKDTGT